ncbi:MAG: hypothetical protein OXF84_10270 [Bacteroidetes bacterium]|nr:hypothetical protein [Bacteroidota bacterium]
MLISKFKYVIVVGAFCVISHYNPLHAQAPILVQITSNDPNAAVYADSLYLGLVHGSPYWVHPSIHRIRLRTLMPASWSVPPISSPLVAQPSDTVQLALNFPMYHRVESFPLGAETWLQSGEQRRFLGVTPVVFHSHGLRDSLIHVEMEAYESATIQPKTEIWNVYNVSLTPLESSLMSASGASKIEKKQRQWIDWGLATVAVVAGVLAVDYKFRADRINDRYLETGDTSLRPRVARLDDYSGVALGVMQAGIITLGIRFVLD